MNSSVEKGARIQISRVDIFLLSTRQKGVINEMAGRQLAIVRLQLIVCRGSGGRVDRFIAPKEIYRR